MLLTVLFIMVTVMQARRLLYLKTQLQAVFKRNRLSIMLYTKSPQHTSKDNNGSKQDETFMSSDLCSNKHLAKLSELLWYENDIKLCTIHPEQVVNVSSWLAYPQGTSSYPLSADNCFQSSSTSNSKLKVLVEADLAAYKPQASKAIAKLENYGLIVTWMAQAANTNINFILESDVEHITNFLTTIMQGQYYINNDLLVTRIQTVLVSGEPCTYDNKQLSSLPDKALFYALSNVAQTATQQKKSMELVKYGLNVYPQGENSSNVVADPIKKESTSNISITTSATPVASTAPAASTSLEHGPDKESANTRDSSKQTSTANKEKIKAEARSSVLEKELAVDTSSTSTKRIDSTKESVTAQPLSSTYHVPNLGEGKSKPPNVVIYADSPDAVNNVKTVLKKVLDPDRYIIYALTRDEARLSFWISQVSLVIVCGNIDAEVSAQLVEYVIHGGKLLALCSDMLHTLLPSFKTAEVRESELVRFSYGKWKRVRMMHHIFCYHASPVRTRFFQDHEDTRTSALNPPASTRVKDQRGILHSFDVKVLGTEETWHNPSILLATLASSGGKVVFSQIHLEVDPTQYEYEEDKFNALKESNAVRLEIIGDLLSTHLGMETTQSAGVHVQYTPAYFLGIFQTKKKMLDKMKVEVNSVLKMPKLDIGFYTSSTVTVSASETFLPIMVHLCPANFSTVQYFENLYTTELGRLVIYADVLTSSMHITEQRLEHGLAVIPRVQTQGQGRGRNMWLSPVGCAMFTLQLHIPKDSILGARIPLLQHVAAVAIITAVRSRPGYENINLRLKWPNDIYFGDLVKIGGLIVSTQTEGSQYICNVGAGINLSNSKPTICINDLIEQHNKKYHTKLSKFSYEQYLAFVFNELENLVGLIQDDNLEEFYKFFYYKYWLHTNSKVTIQKANRKVEEVTIVGITDYGFLSVLGKDGNTFSVHPDGNRFDLLQGLILPC